MKKPKKRQKVVRGWAGFVDGKLHEWSIDCGPCQLGIWRTRSEARKRFSDVRKVEVRTR